MLYIILLSLIKCVYCDYLCQDAYHYYSTKTSYQTIVEDVSQTKECSVKSIWMFVRNGAKFPNEEDITAFSQMDVVQEEILENHDKYHSGELCEEEIADLRAWKFKVKKNESLSLSGTGYEELARLGESLRELILSTSTNDLMSSTNIKITSDKVSKQSAIAFTEGLFGFPLPIPDSAVDDELLMNEKSCSAWEASTKREKLKEEIELMENSFEMQELLQEVQVRLGFLRTLPLELVKFIYELCAHESSWSQEVTSPWCPALTVNHLKVLEFLKDLTHYYRSGYGNPLTEKLGCSLLADMIKWMKSEDQKPTLYFGDSLGVFKLLVSLGISGGDTPLEGDSYQNSSSREWRTSYLNPYASNILAVIYNCPERTANGAKEKVKLILYLNGYPIRLPACSGSLPCDIDDFVNYFTPATLPLVCNRDFCEKKF